MCIERHKREAQSNTAWGASVFKSNHDKKKITACSHYKIFMAKTVCVTEYIAQTKILIIKETNDLSKKSLYFPTALTSS